MFDAIISRLRAEFPACPVGVVTAVVLRLNEALPGYARFRDLLEETGRFVLTDLPPGSGPQAVTAELIDRAVRYFTLDQIPITVSAVVAAEAPPARVQSNKNFLHDVIEEVTELLILSGRDHRLNYARDLGDAIRDFTRHVIHGA